MLGKKYRVSVDWPILRAITVLLQLIDFHKVLIVFCVCVNENIRIRNHRLLPLLSSAALDIVVDYNNIIW